MKSGLTVVLDNLSKVAAGINLIATKRVLVGVPADKASRSGGPINNAALAYIHENGAPEVHIPARPFLVPGIKSVQDEVTAGLRKGGEFALDGRPDAVDRQFHRVGAIGRDAVKTKIGEGIPPPLKESTLRARARRGRKGAVKELGRRAKGLPASMEFAIPLIDTGALRNSMNYVVRDKKT